MNIRFSSFDEEATKELEQEKALVEAVERESVPKHS